LSVERRTLLALGAGLAADRALAQPSARSVPAPPAADASAWTAYEARLRARLHDAGGGAFDGDGGRLTLDLVNRARAAAGASPVAWHEELDETARAHAGDLVRRGYVEHISPEGFEPSHRFWLIGRTTIGSPSENIAYHRGSEGRATPQQLVQLWRDSPGHWRNVLRPLHTHAAFALVRTPGKAWLVGLFARPLATLPEPLAFRAVGPEISRALRSLSADLRASVSIPQGSRLGDVNGPPPVLQITAVRPAGLGAYDVIGGPIFLAAA
jgi:uncharacterized protein YkwD